VKSSQIESSWVFSGAPLPLAPTISARPTTELRRDLKLSSWNDRTCHTGLLSCASSSNTSGLIGGDSCRRASAPQSSEAKNGWACISTAPPLAPSRRFGSRVSS
jgi:hypothetical protein